VLTRHSGSPARTGSASCLLDMLEWSCCWGRHRDGRSRHESRTPAWASTSHTSADIDVAQALRRYVREGDLDPTTAAAALENLRSLDLERHGHEPLLDRVWSLRENLTAYDAVYVALAEALDSTLLTCDGRLARAPEVSKRVELVR